MTIVLEDIVERLDAREIQTTPTWFSAQRAGRANGLAWIEFFHPFMIE